uniref:Phosphatidylinositol-glycan biosynthesis class X protein n=1 Tax=Tetradesmus obliquus TaxID=3088 RepID=A0A383WGT5_TETOB|eukprot:jgi/Sobl393_1/2725/SZX76707.1
MENTLCIQEGCQTSLLQLLPSSIYADPYQLEDLVRSSSSDAAAGPSSTAEGTAYTFQLLGPLDLELPAPACKANVLLLGFNMTQRQQQQQQQEGKRNHQRLKALLSVPLHAKYPEPHAFGFQGWQALSSGHIHVVVPQPWLLLDCRQAGGQLQVLHPPPEQQQPEQQQQVQMYLAASDDLEQQQQQQQQQQGQPELLLWSVPAGNLDHVQLVSWGTLLVAAACCAALSVRALQVMAAV